MLDYLVIKLDTLNCSFTLRPQFNQYHGRQISHHFRSHSIFVPENCLADHESRYSLSSIRLPLLLIVFCQNFARKYEWDRSFTQRACHRLNGMICDANGWAVKVLGYVEAAFF